MTQKAELSSFIHLSDFPGPALHNQSEAQAILTDKSVDAKRVSEILVRYSKEARRLHVDLKHQREQKVLSIKQRLESELVDEIPSDFEWDAVSQLIESTVPSVNCGAGASLIIGNSLRVFDSHRHANITINVNPQIVGTVNGVIAQEINGDQNLGAQGQELLELVQKYGDTRANELITAIYEVEDRSVPKPDRLKAGQKLKKFIIEVARKGGDVAAGVLQKYIESQLGL